MNRTWAMLALGSLLGLGTAARASADEHERFEVHERTHDNFPRPDFEEEPRRFDERAAKERARWDVHDRAVEKRRKNAQRRSDETMPTDDAVPVR